MTNLFVGGEDIEFGLIAGVVNTVAGHFDAAMARCSLKPTADIGIVHTFANELAVYLAANNKMWYGYQWRGGGGGFTFGTNVITFYRAGNPFFQIRQRGSAGQCGATTYDNAGAPTDYAPSIIAQSGIPTEHTFWINIGNPGFIRWYIGGTLWWEFVGNTAAMGAGGAGAIMDKAIWGSANSNGDSDFSEIMVTSDDDSRLGKRLCTLHATADGFWTAWTGGYADIDEITEDTTDSINTPTVGDRETFVFSDLPVLSAGVVPQAIVISSKMQTQVGAPQNVKGQMRIAGVDYETTAKPVSNVPGNVQFYVPVSPATTATWLASEVNGAEYGHRAA